MRHARRNGIRSPIFFVIVVHVVVEVDLPRRIDIDNDYDNDERDGEARYS